ncbi:hypothetical protein HQ865_18600 [Mucilaginibacter mali]|uniref:Uncharacterized protein n=1 Tax=Mucilaginibacter mali TaxID=2740462 RepID=A0A7D4QVI0_9SPHI|nr:hypothetical protein [Mucilaginibacter mali]QKJ31689.1 hypothetical protein HQ865_18600 [Mucilaginibacter mali]
MDAIELLSNVLEVFKANRNATDTLKYLLENNILHPSFEQRYVLNNDAWQFTITGKNEINTGLVEFYLEASDRCPYRAEVLFEDKWYLRSFMFLCPGCFGEDRTCGVCDGSGWGVL